jgi:hypothetical protein
MVLLDTSISKGHATSIFRVKCTLKMAYAVYNNRKGPQNVE